MPQIKSFQVDSTIITEDDLGVRVQDYNPEIVTVKNNFAGAVAPSTSDDDAAGYEVGSRWVDIATDNEYVCLDATTSNAVWAKTTNTSVGINDNSDTVAMTITVAEDIGIGETVPLGKLHVKSGASGATVANVAGDDLIVENFGDAGMTIFSSTTSNGYIFFGDSAGNTIGRIRYDHNADLMDFRTNNATALTIDSTQNIGIGTPSPDFKLEVEGPVFGGVTTATAHNTNNGVVLEYDTVSGDDMVTACAIGNNNRNLELRALSAGTPNNNQIYLHGANNTVGIGTATHDGTLHVFSGSAGSVDASTSANELVLENSDHVGIHMLCPDLKQGIIYFGTPSRQLGAVIAWDYTANKFLIGSNNPSGVTSIVSSNNVEAIHIDGSQNIGIGKVPTTILDIEAVTAHMKLTSSTGTNFCTTVYNNTAGSLNIGLERSTGSALLTGDTAYAAIITHQGPYPLQFGTNATLAMTIDSSQNVGIGIDSPDGRLHAHASSCGTVTAHVNANTIVAEAGLSNGISILVPDSSSSIIMFGSPSSNRGAELNWVYNSSAFLITTRKVGAELKLGSGNAVTALTIASTGAIKTAGSFESNGIGTYSALHSVATATDVDITWKEATTLLNVAYIYKFKLVTTGTGSNTGSSYIVWYNDVSALWEFRLISRAGSTSNSPLLKINVAGTKAQVYHNHATTYSIQIISEYFFVIESDAQPHMFGSDYMWQRDIDDLYYTDGDVGIGETAPLGKLHVKTADSGASAVSSAANELVVEGATATGISIVGGASDIMSIMFGDSAVSTAGRVYYNNSTNEMSLWSNATQRMTIQSTGSIAMVKTAVGALVTVGHEFNVSGECRHTVDGGTVLLLNRKTSDGILQAFYKDTVIYGNIAINATVTTYNTTSDYRLKENITPITDGIDRIKLLNPSRFNFINQEDTVDGFLAHEVQEVVPESAHGIKDEVDDENNPVHQSMDASRLVPLLTAALKELNEKVEMLEAKVSTLEGGK